MEVPTQNSKLDLSEVFPNIYIIYIYQMYVLYELEMINSHIYYRGV